MAAFTVRTVCIMSISNSCRQASSSSRHGQRRDVGDDDVDAAQRRRRASATQPSSAALSATSTAWPKAVTPLALQCGDRRVDLGRVAGADRDIGAFVGEDVGAAPADALAAAGDERVQCPSVRDPWRCPSCCSAEVGFEHRGAERVLRVDHVADPHPAGLGAEEIGLRARRSHSRRPASGSARDRRCARRPPSAGRCRSS